MVVNCCILTHRKGVLASTEQDKTLTHCGCVWDRIGKLRDGFLFLFFLFPRIINAFQLGWKTTTLNKTPALEGSFTRS